MNVLVTGGAGFLGSHFVRAVLADRLPGLEGASVTILDKLSYGTASFDTLGDVAHAKRLDFVPGDACDPALVGALVPRCDTIVHAAFAGQASHVLATSVLLSAAQRHGSARFVHMSCETACGPGGPHPESARLAPTSPAAAALAGADLLAVAFHRTHGLPAMVVRGSTTYGTHQHPAGVLPRAVTRLLDGGTVPLRADRERDWLHVDDHCRAIALVLARGRPGETYHVGGSVELSERALIAMVLDEMGAGPDRVADAPLPTGDDLRCVLDDGKIRDELGWQPQVEFATGLAATIRWYREHPGWWRPQIG
ncbi:dTDP-glucose 4,6-dehydratase [Paractinoplanes deccanensis]|uniref:dTDP-glucose 4,6-dehydratase n=1 Tax=Paractinoplanes deccanensis TaxID=113561 RepID=A0ABQ3Y5A3_9ACTN|nr:NAD-dependent epimerase/dehydratase family protein [Actinoplanes deccanensis]GID75157.1 dTDP-glucose 4,6-dehydratase [Actinoplanes deccanensis]